MSSTIKSSIKIISMADKLSWYLSLMLVAVMLISSLRADHGEEIESVVHGRRSLNRPCDEIYVVSEGETLNTISDKCGDPFIVEENPHIHDPDDVFPGLVIKITPSSINKGKV